MATADQDLAAVLAEERVVGVVRARRIRDARGLARALAATGVTTIEFTLTTPGALAAIRDVASDESTLVGAGTVLTADDARTCVSAGARFLVTPAVVPEVAEVAHEAGVPVLMGALTPSEVLAATLAGATAVKVFPARLGGAAYLGDLMGPFPNVALVPSGGVDPRNARAFLDAGALAVCAGSSSIAPADVERGDHARIAAQVGALVAAVGRGRVREAAG
jgi:2-dehydro-3-deoxyphosphogluconate aldolase / (4S)-4-hydroxy-2-oxoglutarate aldolase